MFLFVSDEEIKEQVLNKGGCTYLFTKDNANTKEYVFLVDNDIVLKELNGTVLTFGLKTNPKYRISNNLVF